MESTEKGLILKVGRFREADLWVRYCSATSGVRTAFAFGGARSVKRFCGCLDALNVVLFKVRESRGGAYLNLMEGTLVKSFPKLRSDASRLGPVVNCLKFFEAVTVDPVDSAGSYELLLGVLDVLEQEDRVSALFPLLFRARLVFCLGLCPDLTTCSQCGKDIKSAGSGSFFMVEAGRVVCHSCARPSGHRVRLGAGAVSLFDQVLTKPPSQWHDLEPPAEVRRQCYGAVDSFVRYHLGLAWEGGRFKKV
jgi:DNA repair protein RecO (recombination protein O)